MAVAFGTSGLRGPAVDFTDFVCTAYTTAFLEYCSRLTEGRDVYLAADLRDSSPTIAGRCMAAIAAAGWTGIWAGNVPTPAVAFHAMARRAPAIMITGSHIPETYNGIKFYRPDGELLKDDEAPIGARAEVIVGGGRGAGTAELGTPLDAVAEGYVRRYVEAFGASALSGMRIGIDLHSAVGRDLTVRIFEGLGAEVLPFRREVKFIAVDTEALDPADIDRARTLIASHGLDAVVSTDGDGDRPLVIDNAGRQINGDVLGMLTAKALGARSVVTPLSSTSAVEEANWFDTVIRTKIGSPHVVAAMAQAEAAPIVGFEANGGFLLQQDVTLGDRRLERLPTRDAILPAVASLGLARQQGLALSELVETLPSRMMKADRMKDVPPETAVVFLAKIQNSAEFRQNFHPRIATPVGMSTLDGVRMGFATGDTVHFRRSGNAPEMRIYVETGSLAETESLLDELMTRLRATL